MTPSAKRLFKNLLDIHNLNVDLCHIIGLDKAIYMCSSRLYFLWQKIYNEPDRADIIVFNEQHRLGIKVHSDIKCPRKFCEYCRTNRIIMYLNNAKHSIDAAHMAISNRYILSALVDAWTRGVTVRIVTDSQMLDVRGSAISIIWSIGIAVRSPSTDTVMHHKFAIIDGEKRILQLDADKKHLHSRLWSRKRGYVMTGSLNWTKQGTCNNYENVVITSNRTVQSLYQTIFDHLWSISQPLEKMGLPGYVKQSLLVHDNDDDDYMNNAINAIYEKYSK